MYSLIIFAVMALYARQQGNFFLGLLMLPSLFFYSLAYELKDSALSAQYFDFNYINDYSLYIVFGFVLIFSVVAALNRRISGRAVELDPPAPMPPTAIRRATIIYYVLSSVATIAFVTNLSNVNFDIGLLFLNPRIYEEIFGKSTGVNYLYFLNVPALCISIYLRQKLKRPHAAGIIDAILIFMSFFHGIKFTVFDTFLLPALFYFHCSRQPRRALFVLGLTVFVLLCFYLAFSVGVRGFLDDEGPLFSAILNYILPNFYNLAYSIQVQPIQFDPISILIPDKVPNPLLPILSPGEYGFILNDRFNMATAYANIYAILPPFSWLLFAPLLVRFRYRVILLKRRTQKLHWVFIAAYIDFCIFFVWYFYAFNKTKYVYYVIVMVTIGYIVHLRTTRRISAKKVRL